ncbi:MAG: hypothetical protein GYB66_08195 [Chloroflexi bacterium]|nr:hypothetical protein [Chloroflexota bacterium]
MSNLGTWKWLPLLLLGVFVLAACGSEEPEHADDIVFSPEEAISIAFEDFEVGTFGDGSSLSTVDSTYLVNSTNEDGNRYLFGVSQDPALELKNLRIDVTATPRSGGEDNWYGVMCRVDTSGQGYAFLISGDGFWALARATGRNLDFLENWQETDAINTGRESNEISVRCVEDYLALYVNGEFVGDHNNGDISTAGAIGLLAGGAEDNAITVAFEDLVVTPAHFEGRPNTATPPPASTDTPETQTPIPQSTIELAPLSPQDNNAINENQAIFGG